MKNNVMPPLVLMLICIAVCALLVFAHDMTYVDNTGVLTDDMKKGCNEIFGDGDYEMLLNTENGKKIPVNFGDEQINSVISDKKNQHCLIEITCDGYAKGGLHLLVGIDDQGKIQGLHFLSIGETPGLGAKVADNEYKEKYKGVDSSDQIEKIDNLTAATYSSKGLKKACEDALKIYNEHKGEIFA